MNKLQQLIAASLKNLAEGKRLIIPYRPVEREFARDSLAKWREYYRQQPNGKASFDEYMEKFIHKED